MGYDSERHTCRPPGCPGIHLHPDVARQIGVKWHPPCPLRPFTCPKCGRRWVVSGEGWKPAEDDGVAPRT